MDSTKYYQYYRADNSLYFKGRLGLNFYGGDRDINPENEIQKYIENIGFSLGLEVGYAVTDRFSIGLKHLSGRYPRIEDEPFPPSPTYPGFLDLDPATTSKWRHHFTLLGRAYILPDKRISPYGQLGFNVSFGQINDGFETGIGPEAAIGLDAAVSDHLGIFIELNGIFAFDDGALDFADTRVRNPGGVGGTDASDFDAFTFFGFGLRYTLKSPIVPVTVVCTPPSDLIPGQAGTFFATSNDNATRPITYQWDFGDGTTGTGLLTTHTYTQPGTYTVRVTATNRGGTATDVCEVTVLQPPLCRSVTATPAAVESCQPAAVTFEANVEGAQPITYTWNFGDGSPEVSGEGRRSVSHTYPAPTLEEPTRTYTTTLRLSNDAGTATCAATNVVVSCPCVDNVVMASIDFDRNASVLKSDPATMTRLRDNIDLLQRNASARVYIIGFATANERYMQTLSEDRARAVEKFYTDNGVAATRIQIEGIALDARPKSGVPPVVTILYCTDEKLQQDQQRLQQDIGRDMRERPQEGR